MAETENIKHAEQQIAALNARDLDQYLSRIDASYGALPAARFRASGGRNHD